MPLARYTEVKGPLLLKKPPPHLGAWLRAWPANCPASGGTVPQLISLSRCPIQAITCPASWTWPKPGEPSWKNLKLDKPHPRFARANSTTVLGPGKRACKIASGSLWPGFASANQLSVRNASPQLFIHDHLPFVSSVILKGRVQNSRWWRSWRAVK